MKPDTIGVTEHLDKAMLELSRLSTAARADGNERVMYAANRAWRGLDQAKRNCPPPPPKPTPVRIS